MDAILKKSAWEIATLYESHQISPVEVVQLTLDWVSQANSSVNAFTVVDPDRAIKQARASEQRWERKQPLNSYDGIPVTIKDSFDVKGWKSCFGSKLKANAVPAENNSIAADDLEHNGMVILGKTTMPESFWKISNESPLTGVTRNPWDLEKTPGGSSGGASAATALGMGFAGLGSDGAGSIRVPASFCGLVGLKPTHGVIPVAPPSMSGSFSAFGPITRCVKDTAQLLNVLQHETAADPLTIGLRHHNYVEDLEKDFPTTLKIAFTPDMYSPYTIDNEIETSFANCLNVVANCRHELRSASPITSQAQAESAIELIASLRFPTFWSMFKNLSSEELKEMDQDLLATAELGRSITIEKYLDAQQQQRLLNIQFARFFEEYDFLIMPTVHEPAFDINAPAFPPNPISLPYSTMLFNMTMQPAISIPCGITKSGLPIGLQIIGKHFDDKRLLQFAYMLEQRLAFKAFQFDLSDFGNQS